MNKLIQKYINENYSEDELKKVFDLFEREMHLFDGSMKECWDTLKNNDPGMEHLNFDQYLDKIHHRISINESKQAKPFEARKVNKLYRWTIRVAAFLSLPLLALSVWLLVSKSDSAAAHRPMFSSATLPGQQSTVLLPDGSKVWLNGESTLKYASDYGNHNRSLYLSGEAYFKVAKNKELPFVVHAKDQNITALGTQFNVVAYKSEKYVTVVLEEGAVKVENVQNSVVLKPGDKAEVGGDNVISIKSVAPEKHTSWHTGKVMLKANYY